MSNLHVLTRVHYQLTFVGSFWKGSRVALKYPWWQQEYVKLTNTAWPYTSPYDEELLYLKRLKKNPYITDGHIPNLLCGTPSIYPTRPTLPHVSCMDRRGRASRTGLCLMVGLAKGNLSRRSGYLFFDFPVRSLYVSLKLGVSLDLKVTVLEDNFSYTTLSLHILLTSLLLTPLGQVEVTALPLLLSPGSCTISMAPRTFLLPLQTVILEMNSPWNCLSECALSHWDPEWRPLVNANVWFIFLYFNFIQATPVK